MKSQLITFERNGLRAVCDVQQKLRTRNKQREEVRERGGRGSECYTIRHRDRTNKSIAPEFPSCYAFY